MLPNRAEKLKILKPISKDAVFGIWRKMKIPSLKLRAGLPYTYSFIFPIRCALFTYRRLLGTRVFILSMKCGKFYTKLSGPLKNLVSEAANVTDRKEFARIGDFDSPPKGAKKEST